MTIDEIAKTLPNGFHDSNLTRLEVNYIASSARLAFDIDATPPDVHGRGSSRIMRTASVDIDGLLYFAIEPPFAQSFAGDYVGDDRRMWITSDTADFSSLRFEDDYHQLRLPTALANGAFQHMFYSSSHNCCLYLAGMSAKFTWTDISDDQS